MIEQHIKKNLLRIHAKPHAPHTEVKGWDRERKALVVYLHAQPEDGKANRELVRFFSKRLKKKVTIKSGLSSRDKVLRIG